MPSFSASALASSASRSARSGRLGSRSGSALGCAGGCGRRSGLFSSRIASQRLGHLGLARRRASRPGRTRARLRRLGGSQDRRGPAAGRHPARRRPARRRARRRRGRLGSADATVATPATPAPSAITPAATAAAVVFFDRVTVWISFCRRQRTRACWFRRDSGSTLGPGWQEPGSPLRGLWDDDRAARVRPDAGATRRAGPDRRRIPLVGGGAADPPWRAVAVPDLHLRHGRTDRQLLQPRPAARRWRRSARRAGRWTPPTAGIHRRARLPGRHSARRAPTRRPAVFGAPAAELDALVEDGTAILGPAAARLRDRLAEVPTWSKRFELVRAYLRRRARPRAGPIPPAGRGGGGLDLAGAAARRWRRSLPRPTTSISASGSWSRCSSARSA